MSKEQVRDRAWSPVSWGAVKKVHKKVRGPCRAESRPKRAFRILRGVWFLFPKR